MRCEPARDFTVAKAIAWRSAIDDDPTYQRAGEVWSLPHRQLFVDSLLNGYDVPKVYLHDLRGQHPTKVYAVVDGKQRLTTLWSFVRDGFPLAPTFRIEAQDGPPIAHEASAPVGALRYSELDPRWQAAFLRTPLSVVLIRSATESDIEELFSRLNNGVALSAAERRNAFGGEMADLIRDVAGRSSLFGALGFTDGRGEHLDLAAWLLAWEDARRRNDLASLDVSPSGVDAFVRGRRLITPAERAELAASLERRWALAADLFGHADPLLSTPDDAFEILRLAWQALEQGPPAGRMAEVRAALAEHRARRRPDPVPTGRTAAPSPARASAPPSAAPEPVAAGSRHAGASGRD